MKSWSVAFVDSVSNHLNRNKILQVLLLMCVIYCLDFSFCIKVKDCAMNVNMILCNSPSWCVMIGAHIAQYVYAEQFKNDNESYTE